MFNWLTSLFRSDPVPPTDSQPIYRRSIKPATKPRPVTDTLFERPTDLPPAPVVDVVPPGTQADAYKWLDYEKPPTPVPESIAIIQTEPVDTDPSGGRWSALSGSMLSFTGMCYNVCTTGVWRGSAKSGKILLDRKTDPSHYDDFAP